MTGVDQRPVDRELELLDCTLVLFALGGSDTVDHLSSGESGGVHEETLDVGTDTFDQKFEDVENSSAPSIEWFRDARWRSLLNHRTTATGPTNHNSASA